MSTPTLTRDLAWSIAQDRANHQMCAAGRSKWSRADYELAVETFDRLWPGEKDYAHTAARATAPAAACTHSSEDLPSVVHALSKQLDQLEADKEYNAECAELWRGVVRKLLAGDLSAFTEEERQLVDRARQELHADRPEKLMDCGSPGPEAVRRDVEQILQNAVGPLGRATRLPYQHVHHVDGDPTNNDLDNLEVRTGYADVDGFDARLSEFFPGQPRWMCPRCERRTIGGYCNGCGHRYAEGYADVDPVSKGRES